MSDRPSPTPRRRSSAAPNDSQPQGTSLLDETSQTLVARGVYGFVWLDADLVARRKSGPIVDFVTLDRPIAESVLPLRGLEEVLEDLKTAPDPVLEFPNTIIHSRHHETPRINISVFWRAAEKTYVVLIGRVLSQAVFEIELQAEVKRRLLAEEQVRQKSAELEQFAYIISHDLRTPLRGLRHLSTDIEAALDGPSPDIARARGVAADMIVQTRRMGQMLLGLLEYAQIGRRPEAMETIDSGTLIREIATGLRPAPGQRVVIEGSWPAFETFVAPLDLVLRNLIDNALKHHDRPEATITVSADEDALHWIFTVADDGPGIPREWQRAIFEPFRKIDAPGRSGAEGSGIGLALVKKAAETIGGHIDVSSAPPERRGTRFRVFWPKTARI